MAYKDIVVVLDDTEACRERVDVALRLAAHHEAHLVGLFVLAFGYIPTFAEAQIPQEVFEQRRKTAEAARTRVRRTFETQSRNSGVTVEWRTVDDDVLAAVNLHSRYADLTVVGQFDPRASAAYGAAADLAEHLVLGSGRPVLAVPYSGHFPTLGTRVMVAWDASREAARAVADALPVLSDATSVSTLSINPESGDAAGTHGDLPGADIALHLARHGIKVEAQQLQTRDVSPANMILSRAADESIDLLVMGAYGHARVRELVLGGVTREVMRQMTVPVLMSH